MKWHRNLYDGLREALTAYRSGKQPERILDALFRARRKWGKRDREQIRTYFYTYLRRKNYIDRLAAACLNGHPDATLLSLIWATDGTWPDWISPTGPWDACLKETAGQLQRIDAYRLNYPEWFLERSQKLPPALRQEILENLNIPSLPVIRINTLKIRPDAFLRLLDRHGYAYRRGDAPESVIFLKNYRLTATDWYRKGLFEIQDLHSQQTLRFAGIRPGQTVIDACAGAGGKTLQLAALMNNTGRLVALDIDASKLDRLRRRARRAGVRNLEEIALPRASVLQKWTGSADMVITDAPCSSSGTYKRKPHRKWLIDRAKWEQILVTQRHILDQYAGLVRPGGHLIYITCSVLPDENREQIDAFLKRNNSFTFVAERHFLPGREAGDGFYVAKLKRNEV